MQSFIGDEPFLLSYGDGVANIDIDDLLRFHKEHGKMVTVTVFVPLLALANLSFHKNA